jgi:hypothetical protein
MPNLGAYCLLALHKELSARRKIPLNMLIKQAVSPQIGHQPILGSTSARLSNKGI